jgi:hypothetical protein
MAREIEDRLLFWRRLIRRMFCRDVAIVFDDQAELVLSPEVVGIHSRCLRAEGGTIVLRRGAVPEDSVGVLIVDGIVVHELAHELLSIEQPRQATAEVQATVQHSWRSWPVHRGATWAGHDATFIRALLHLIHRVQGHGVRVCLPVAFSHSAYGLSSLEQYQRALGEEPAMTDWLPLDAVLAREAPLKFQNLWSRDIRPGRTCDVLKRKDRRT